MVKEKTIVGLTEKVKIIGKNTIKTFKVKVDTGAKYSSIDFDTAYELKLGPILKTKRIRSSHGRSNRGLILVPIILKGKKLKAYFTLADRKRMTYKVLIGVNVLKRGFLVDPSRGKFE